MNVNSHSTNRRIYWTDSHHKVLESSDLHGNDRHVVKNFSRQVASGHIVGLAITSSSTDDDDNDGDDVSGDNDGDGGDEEDEKDSNDVIVDRRTRERFIVTGFAGLVFMGAINDDDDLDDDDDDDDNKEDYKKDFEMISLSNQKLYGAVTLRSYKDWKALKSN